MLGRETALQPVAWTADGWPRITGGAPAVTVPAPGLAPSPLPSPPSTDHFEASGLGPEWSSLRRPATPDWAVPAPGRLRITGGQSPLGRRAPSLVARRVTACNCSFETELVFSPRTPDHLAGLTAYYNTHNWHYLYATVGDDGNCALQALSSTAGRLTAHPVGSRVEPGAPVVLRAELEGRDLRFSYDPGDGPRVLPIELDATILSEEHADEFSGGQATAFGFTGAMLGMWVLDLDGAGVHADFSYATYRTSPESHT